MHMTADDAVRLLEALTRFLGVLIWPAVVVFILIRFGPAVRDFLSSIGELSLKGAGFEASAKRIRAEAAAALSAAAVRPQPGGATPGITGKEARSAVDFVEQVATPRAIRRARKATVLWVDDHPENNIFERQAMEALGVSFVLATSTDEALTQIKRQSFDAIISDMGRPPDSHAGYTLLDKLRASGNTTPFIIYAGSSAAEHRTEARQHGALGCTNRADELFEMVLSALG